jgi:hypothetical protein
MGIAGISNVVATVVMVVTCNDDVSNPRCYCEYIPDEFGHGASCIENVISLAFYAYIERQKWSVDAIWASILVLM